MAADHSQGAISHEPGSFTIQLERRERVDVPQEGRSGEYGFSSHC